MEDQRMYFHLIDGRTDEVIGVFCTDGAFEYRYDPAAQAWIALKGSTIGLRFQGGDPLLDVVTFAETGAAIEAPTLTAA
ncbi:hypothetical protein ACWGOE_07305 [Leucobacter chromiiresistens]